ALRYQSGGRLRTVPVAPQAIVPKESESSLRQLCLRLAAIKETKEATAAWRRRMRSRISTQIRKLLARGRSRFQQSPMAATPLLFLGAALAAMIFLAYWLLFAVKELGAAMVRTVLFPGRFFFKVNGFQQWFDRLKLALDPLVLAKESECDVWLIPTLAFPYS